MVITKIFPNPTVKKVIFEARFPNLFFIEDKIGKIQLKVMDEFPESALIFQRQFMIVSENKEEKSKTPTPEDFGKKIWQFKSEKNYQFSVTSKSISITSDFHKTYNLGDGDKFRDIIQFVIENFLSVISIPTFTRLGLRYIDHCPMPAKNNVTFSEYYDSVLPIERFNIAEAEELFFRTNSKKGHYNIIYMEEMRKIKNKHWLILDFDASGTKIPTEKYLKVTDELHKMISVEYEKTIKKPVYDYMSQGREK